MSKFSDLNIDDNDDEPDVEIRVQKSAASILAELALKEALDAQARKILKSHPGIFIVAVPSEPWVSPIAKVLKSMDRAPFILEVSEQRKSGGKLQRTGADALDYLHQGRSVLFVSQNPDDFLDEQVLVSADLYVRIPALSPKLLRKAIGQLTHGVARGVTEEHANLDLDIVLACLRPGTSSRQCVDNLQRAVERLRKPRSGTTVPSLDKLPLTQNVREWTDDMLADLDAVKAGTLSPDRLAHGILEGPPGTGKTLIAESLAKTAGWSFVPSSVGAWFASGDGALGGVARNLKNFIDQILSSEPAIGFMDELDALPNRATMDNKGRDWWTPVINLFLTEIDRLRKSNKKVLLIGATNYYDRLDAALVRPGRLQQRVPILPPTTEAEMIALLRYYLKSDLVDADLGTLARVGQGATPAAIEGWIKEARGTARAANRSLEPGDILARMVPKDNREPADIRSVAIHEAGHAIVAHQLGHVVESVSIIPDGDAGGLTTTLLPTEMPTWQNLLDMVTVSLGGRAADIVLGRGPDMGAEADLAKATKLLLGAWERQGLRESLAFVPAFGIRSAAALNAVNGELKEALDRAIAIVQADRDLTLHLAERLIVDRVLSGNVLAELLGPRPQPPGPRRKSSHTRRDKEQPSQQNTGYA